MKKKHRLYLLSGILVGVCLLTLGVSRIKEHKEDIRVNGSTILSVPVDTVTGFSLNQNGETYLSFHKTEGLWHYDEDENFPASAGKIEDLLAQFEDFAASFTIEGVEDFAQYGLDKPIATVKLETADKDYEISMGQYSTMDSQRYVSIGDGNAYLAVNDPMDSIDLTLRDLIEDVTIPSLKSVQSISFASEEESYTLRYLEEGGPSHRSEDVWFADLPGGPVPLDTDRVEDYIQAVSVTALINYTDYYTTEEELAQYGLDKPELTISIDYLDDSEQAQTFTLMLSADPESVKEHEKNADDPVTGYARVEGSDIVYRLDSMDYEALNRYHYNDLRYNTVLPAELDDAVQVAFRLEGKEYRFEGSGSGEDRTWTYQGEKVENGGFQKELAAVTVSEFTDEQPGSSKVELSYTVTLKDGTELLVELYRHDGENCLAVVDGQPLGLVLRSKVVDLTEAVNAIVLNPGDKPE